jgi:hypothetical protein
MKITSDLTNLTTGILILTVQMFFEWTLQQVVVIKVDSSCKKPLVICNSIFFIFLNQIKAQRDHKIIVWIEYFSYNNNFKVISNDECHKSAVANVKWFFAT